jgi:hemerythrin-like metal-binding protein
MLTLYWKPDMGTGNEAVDLQHQYFVTLINRIAINLADTRDDAYRMKLLDEIRKYADFHFTSEENIAFACGKIVGLHSHHERHQELLTELHDHTSDLLKGHYTVEEYIQFLHEWFVGHTIREDRLFFGGG